MTVSPKMHVLVGVWYCFGILFEKPVVMQLVKSPLPLYPNLQNGSPVCRIVSRSSSMTSVTHRNVLVFIYGEVRSRPPAAELVVHTLPAFHDYNRSISGDRPPPLRLQPEDVACRSDKGST